MGSRIDRGWYRGRRVLDAGCGHGRYLAAFASLGAEVVGLEAGPLRCAQESLGSGPRIGLVRGSVLAPPLRESTFDLVFCDGVLHHTDDPRRGYLALARLVRPGGALYTWLYPAEGSLRETVFGVARALTTRLPGPMVLGLSFALAPLTIAVRSYSGTRWGRATWAECAQVVHDWIAPPLQSHHTPEEVEGWAAEAGLGAVERLPIPVGTIAWRSAAPAWSPGDRTAIV
jgi:SAM-dependent methyltransferase